VPAFESMAIGLQLIRRMSSGRQTRLHVSRSEVNVSAGGNGRQDLEICHCDDVEHNRQLVQQLIGRLLHKGDPSEFSTRLLI
jgi:hypothetical protein